MSCFQDRRLVPPPKYRGYGAVLQMWSQERQRCVTTHASLKNANCNDPNHYPTVLLWNILLWDLHASLGGCRHGWPFWVAGDQELPPPPVQSLCPVSNDNKIPSGKRYHSAPDGRRTATCHPMKVQEGWAMTQLLPLQY